MGMRNNICIRNGNRGADRVAAFTITFTALRERIYPQQPSIQTRNSMLEKLRLTTRIVDDQEKALRFYTEKLGLEKEADQTFGPDDRRWVTVAAEQDDTTEIVLEPLDWFEGEEKDHRASQLGHQPALAFTVDDCQRTYETLRDRGVEFTAEPEERPYGIEAVANDLYGNGVVIVEQHEQ